jgi:hypothetical protein
MLVQIGSVGAGSATAQVAEHLPKINNFSGKLGETKLSKIVGKTAS